MVDVNPVGDLTLAGNVLVTPLLKYARDYGKTDCTMNCNSYLFLMIGMILSGHENVLSFKRTSSF